MAWAVGEPPTASSRSARIHQPTEAGSKLPDDPRVRFRAKSDMINYRYSAAHPYESAKRVIRTQRSSSSRFGSGQAFRFVAISLRCHPLLPGPDQPSAFVAKFSVIALLTMETMADAALSSKPTLFKVFHRSVGVECHRYQDLISPCFRVYSIAQSIYSTHALSLAVSGERNRIALPRYSTARHVLTLIISMQRARIPKKERSLGLLFLQHRS